jgi:hypothetical protein
MQDAMASVGLQTTHLITSEGAPTGLAHTLETYLRYRADVLNTTVKSNLMTAARARAAYEEMKVRFNPQRPVPMNKQKVDGCFSRLVNPIGLWEIKELLHHMLHMGYVDEALFGYETVERLPEIVREWVEEFYSREAGTSRY